MDHGRVLEIIKRRREEANEHQIGLTAIENVDEAQVWWRIMKEYDDLLAEIEALQGTT